MVCIDWYVIRTVRLIRHSQHKNRVSTVCADTYVSDCNSALLLRLRCHTYCIADFYLSEPNELLGFTTYVIRTIRIKIHTYEPQAEWSGSGN